MDDQTELGAGAIVAATIAGGATAALGAAATRFWMLGEAHGPIAVLVGCIAGALLGRVLRSWVRTEAPSSFVARTSVLVLGCGVPAGLVVSLFSDGGSDVNGTVLASEIVAALLLPIFLGATWIARRARRSRPRSVVGVRDRRAPLRIVALWMAIAASACMLTCTVSNVGDDLLAETFWWSWREKATLALAPLVVAAAAVSVALFVLVGDAEALHVARRAARRAPTLRESELGAENATALDLGVGAQAWLEHLSGVDHYRGVAVERLAFVGDAQRAAELSRAALVRSALTLLVVVCAAAFTARTYLLVQARASRVASAVSSSESACPSPLARAFSMPC